MPKKYREIKEKKIKSQLTNKQIKKVDDVGDYVDEQIEASPTNNHVHIPECIMQFQCDHETLDPILYPEPERKLMQDLLLTRFAEAGWRFDHLDLEWILFVRDF